MHSAVLWINPIDETDRGNLLGAAHVAAARAGYEVTDIIEGAERAEIALSAGRDAGALIVPSTERVLPSFAGVADLLDSARADGWRCLLLDFGADSALPSGALIAAEQRALDLTVTEPYELPPVAMRRRVAGFDGEETFRRNGLLHTRSYLSVFESNGGRLAEVSKALDWGSGCGRMTRHLLVHLPEAQITAVDPDVEAIGWVRNNLDVTSALAINVEPPTPLESAAFDLVIGHSVFTHRDETSQDHWLEELARVTRPDAFVLLSVNGPAALAWHVDHPLADLPDSIATTVAHDGIAFWGGDGWEAQGFDGGYHTTFHSPDYVRDHWSQWFNVAAVEPSAVGVQDIVVLRPR